MNNNIIYGLVGGLLLLGAILFIVIGILIHYKKNKNNPKSGAQKESNLKLKNDDKKEKTIQQYNWIPLTEFENNLNLQKIKLVEQFEQDIKKDLNEKAIYYMINAMEQHAEDIIFTRFSFTIKLDDDAIKGKIIGKDGKNKRHFELTTKTDLIIEPNMAAVTISSPNPIRREKAKRTMEKLLETKNIDVNKITNIYKDVEKNFNKICTEMGKNTIENKLKIFDINHDLYPIIGQLNFRTSFSQNVLLHCLECAVLAANLATKLGLDPQKAKKAAFFHDIGKAVDFEIDNDHVNSGVQLAQKYKLDDYIINAIESHHNKVLPSTPYAALVKVVDKLSASRPGARYAVKEDYFKRIEELEKICSSFYGVTDAYVIRAGREIEIIVDASILSDELCKVLINEIKFKLEANEIVNKQPIDITLIRSFVQKTTTKGSASRDK